MPKELDVLKNRLQTIISYILIILIIFFVSVLLYLLYFGYGDVTVRIIGAIGLAIILLLWLAIEFKRARRKTYFVDSNLKMFVLMTNDGEREKEWLCNGVKSFLIGKGTVTTEVDIELGDTHYSEFISDEHAVLNYSGGFWYIEDLNSRNGVGIKKKRR
jgi:hypothetical protein